MVKTVDRIAQALLKQRCWVIGAFQAGLIAFSLVLAWLLRFEFQLPYRRVLISTVPILVAVRLIVIARFKLLHGWWRYAGVSDAMDVGKAVLTGSVLFLLIMRYALGLTNFPLSIYPIEALLTFVILAGVRLASRVLAESVLEGTSKGKNVLLVGAGFAAQMIIRQSKHPQSGYVPLACVDDDPSKQGIKIQGVPVVGTVDQIPDLVQIYPIDEVLIAVPSATSAQMRRFVRFCHEAGVKFRTVPDIRELISGRVRIDNLRDVNLEDLLGREPVKIDLESVHKQIAGRTVMVTGAAGSIGSELCRQITNYAPKALVCVDQSETGIFYLEHELAQRNGSTKRVFAVADVCDPERMAKLFEAHRIQIVFHAAAYKHVPVMEANVQEAVNNNVFGLLSMLEVAERHGCETFVMISSDKAVNPSSVMGCTKRIGELILSAWPADGMRCVSVRFGNVLGSSGSVVPVFEDQLRNNRPLTITHPEIARFFMTIREAVSLVLQAFAVGAHGDILVLEMGDPVRIVDLATSLIRLSGKRPDQVEIKFTGLRRGEKLTEELFYPHEEIRPTACDKVKRTRGTFLDWPDLKRHLDELRASMCVDGAAPIRAKMKEIIPDYSYPPPRPEAEKARVLAKGASHSSLGALGNIFPAKARNDP